MTTTRDTGTGTKTKNLVRFSEPIPGTFLTQNRAEVWWLCYTAVHIKTSVGFFVDE